MDKNGINQKCDTLKAIRLISSIWNNNVKQTTNKNCFNICGLFASNAVVDSCVVSENLRDQVISEDEDTSF